MKKATLVLFLFSNLFLCAQSEKGVSPLSTQNPELTTSETYAVVVGISDYQDEGIPDLRFADKDAEAFADFLRSSAGGSLDEDHLKVLINEEATQAQFAAELDWLWEVAGENDKAFIYFSGHGDVEKKSLTQPGFLLCWDAPSRVYMAGGAFPLPMLQEVISTISVQNKAKVIMVADACRSGKLSGSSVGGAQITGSNLAKQYANEIKILSCQPDEYSLEGEQWGGGRGAFSYHLLDGLYGMADGNGDQKVNLLEISRYLEDHVPIEVAPHSQIPMIVGNKGEQLTAVFPEILAKLKVGKTTGMELFASTESRGIEDDVLATADSNIVEMYWAFKKALKEKRFLYAEAGQGNEDYADQYYAVLSQEPQLEKLHSSMRRNYAAALQEDAQQVMNTMLKTGLTQQVLKAAPADVLYKNYPAYIERAAELLGKDHYMYRPLMARKAFFEGVIENEKTKKRQAFYKALQWQPDMSHALAYLIPNFEVEQVDSAELIAQKAMELVPSWVEPYASLSGFYKTTGQFDKALEILDRAESVDSTSSLIHYRRSQIYVEIKDFSKAEKELLTVIESNDDNICFPCAYQDLGNIYINLYQMDKAEPNLLKAYQLDSAFYAALLTLGNVYGMTGRFDKAEEVLLEALRIEPSEWRTLMNLGNVYNYTNRPEQAKYYYGRVLEIDSVNTNAWFNLGNLYTRSGDYAKAETHYLKALELKPDETNAMNGLGIVYKESGDKQRAEKAFQELTTKFPDYGPGWVNLGDIYMLSGRKEQAKEAYLNILKTPISFAHEFAYTGLGTYYNQMGDKEEAKAHFLKALEKNPRFSSAQVQLINLYFDQGELDNAKAIMDQAIEFGGSGLPKIYILYAMHDLKIKSDASAWDLLEQGLKEGYSDFKSLQEEPEFEAFRNDPKWHELMKKHFPDEHKD